MAQVTLKVLFLIYKQLYQLLFNRCGTSNFAKNKQNASLHAISFSTIAICTTHHLAALCGTWSFTKEQPMLQMAIRCGSQLLTAFTAIATASSLFFCLSPHVAYMKSQFGLADPFVSRCCLYIVTADLIIDEVLEQIKFLAWQWIKAHVPMISSAYAQWQSNPRKVIIDSK